MKDEQPKDEPVLLGIPVRLDATLCEPEEIWIEAPDGQAIRVFPPTDPPLHGREP